MNDYDKERASLADNLRTLRTILDCKKILFCTDDDGVLMFYRSSNTEQFEEVQRAALKAVMFQTNHHINRLNRMTEH